MIALALVALGVAQDTTRKVTWGAFIDTYYAYDFNRPGPTSFDRAFTTQPARHNEFNVNLAHVEAKYSAPRTRARVALQAGTSVQANYTGEPRYGSVSGSELAQHLQEAVVGIKAADNLWIDGGIYFSHIGWESWISRDNPTYTRSLVADYSPYYEAGVKATWTASARLTAQLHVLNGWQNISETNSDKAIGMRLDYAASPHVALGYANFIGNEAPDPAPSRMRVFNEALASLTVDRLRMWLTFDYGTQRRAPASGTSSWWGAVAVGRVRLTPRTALALRVERYVDPDAVIVQTGTPNAFRVWGGSLGIDIAPVPGTVWRTEVRGFTAPDDIFPVHGSGFTTGDGFIVSSLAVTF